MIERSMKFALGETVMFRGREAKVLGINPSTGRYAISDPTSVNNFWVWQTTMRVHWCFDMSTDDRYRWAAEYELSKLPVDSVVLPFDAGQKVRCIDDYRHSFLKFGKVYTVSADTSGCRDGKFIRLEEFPSGVQPFWTRRFEAVEDVDKEEGNEITAEELLQLLNENGYRIIRWPDVV